METALILKSDILDIVFENRNKAYGAYNLRKFYDHRLMKSIAAMLAIVIILSAFTFIPKKKVSKEEDTLTTVTANILAEKKEEPKKKKEPVAAAEKPVNTKKLVPNIVIVKDNIRTDSIDELKPDDRIGNVNITVPDGGDGPVVGKLPAGGGDGPGVTQPEKIPVDPNTVVESPEVMPGFPGGMSALVKFLQKNLTNPRDMEDGEMISVKMRFVVGYDGKLKSFTTVEDGGEIFNKEVIRVLKKMPDWVPGKSNGQNVSVYYTIPVKFVSEN